MNANDLLDRALQMPGATANAPFHRPEPICARVGRRVFAEIYPSRDWVTFRCEAGLVLGWREQYPGAVGRGYYCPASHQRYAFTVRLDGAIPDQTVAEMLEASYRRAVAKLDERERADRLG